MKVRNSTNLPSPSLAYDELVSGGNLGELGVVRVMFMNQYSSDTSLQAEGTKVNKLGDFLITVIT